MTKLPIQNQGFRLDLNLEESFDDDAAWDNLYNPGISKDLAILVNNLRNTSKLGLPSVSISFTTDETNDANYGVTNASTIAPHFFTFTKSNGELVDSTFTNDDIIQFSESITFNIGDLSNGSGTVGSLPTQTFYPGQDFYICSSNARDRFKISTTHSTDPAGISTVPIISVNSNNGSFPSNFHFIRKDAVTAPNLTSFIKPEILDDDFTYLGDSGINGSFTRNLGIYEYSEIMIEKKFKTNKDILTDRDVKFEGSVRVKDPQPYNTDANRLNAKKDDGETPDTPGVFIGNTRAFSTDNNPWAKSSTTSSSPYYNLFSTLSHADEFTIGDLEFGGEIDASGVVTAGKIKINGLGLQNGISEAEIIDIDDTDSKFINKLQGNNVYKFPMIINEETFYILVERE